MKTWQIAVGVALSGFLVASATAAPMSNLGPSNSVSAVEDAKAKGKTKAARKGPGRCGVMMYWDRKKRGCASKG